MRSQLDVWARVKASTPVSVAPIHHDTFGFEVSPITQHQTLDSVDEGLSPPSLSLFSTCRLAARVGKAIQDVEGLYYINAKMG